MANLPIRRFTSPFREVSRLQHQFDRLFDDLLSGFGGYGLDKTEGTFSMPALDFAETEKEYRLMFDLPGVPKEQVKIEIDQSHLIISGERKSEREEKEKGYEIAERFYGAFKRVVPIPSDAKLDDVKATYKDGVLEILIPRTAISKKKTIAIEEKPLLTKPEKGKAA